MESSTKSFAKFISFMIKNKIMFLAIADTLFFLYHLLPMWGHLILFTLFIIYHSHHIVNDSPINKQTTLGTNIFVEYFWYKWSS